MNDHDREMERLEELLSPYRCRVPMPDFRAHAVLPVSEREGEGAGWGQHAPRTRTAWWLAAAAVLAAAVVLIVARFPRDDEWRAGLRTLRVGTVVRTAGEPLRLMSRAVGIVDVAPGSELRIVEVRNGRHRLDLAAGSIHARTFSPPGVFVVDTPRARAIDLGCEYTLSIAPGGGGVLRVESGWVELQRDWIQSLVPRGAAAAINSAGDISAPYFEDTSPAFQAAVRSYSFGGGDRSRDLRQILLLARVRDSFTLLNLFRRGTPEECVLIYDGLNRLVPAPASIARDSVRAWQAGVTEAWWKPVMKASGISPLRKKKGMLRGL
jgi:hypothetical protein